MKMPVFVLITVMLLLSSCNGRTSEASSQAQSWASVSAYKKISAAEAKEMMNREDAVVLDVRSEREFLEGFIEGARLFSVEPEEEFKARAELELTDKNAFILIYCRTGRRSANASNVLLGMGYTNVYDFGGIYDWPYEVVTKTE